MTTSSSSDSTPLCSGGRRGLRLSRQKWDKDKDKDPSDWRSWAKQGLDSFNKLLGDHIKTATGKKSSDDGDKTSGPEKEESTTTQDEDTSGDSDTDVGQDSDDMRDDSDTSDETSSQSDAPDVQDAEFITDASRDHLLDV